MNKRILPYKRIGALVTWITVTRAVIEHRSFTEGAKFLGISKGEASKCVSDLEKQLGQRLIERNTRSFEVKPGVEAQLQTLMMLIKVLDEQIASLKSE